MGVYEAPQKNASSKNKQNTLQIKRNNSESVWKKRNSKKYKTKLNEK